MPVAAGLDPGQPFTVWPECATIGPLLSIDAVMRAFAIALSLGWSLMGSAFAGSSDCSNLLDTPKERDAGRPVLVLVETDPWAMVLGSDSPRFALYENGLAIYRTQDG